MKPAEQISEEFIQRFLDLDEQVLDRLKKEVVKTINAERSEINSIIQTKFSWSVLNQAQHMNSLRQTIENLLIPKEELL